jgi:hypothetical protein
MELVAAPRKFGFGQAANLFPSLPKSPFISGRNSPNGPTKIAVVGEQKFLDFLSAQLYGTLSGRDCSKWNSSLQADFDLIRPVAILVTSHS